MDISVSLPLDNDGFLRRECPNCLSEFKWHHGPANEEAEDIADPQIYYCPLCGEPAKTNAWWTQAQINYVRSATIPKIMQTLDDELSSAFKKSSRKNFTIQKKGHLNIPNEDLPLIEPDDMSIVASPCHSYEPIKVPESAQGPLHCLICGYEYAL